MSVNFLEHHKKISKVRYFLNDQNIMMIEWKMRVIKLDYEI